MIPFFVLFSSLNQRLFAATPIFVLFSVAFYFEGNLFRIGEFREYYQDTILFTIPLFSRLFFYRCQPKPRLLAAGKVMTARRLSPQFNSQDNGVHSREVWPPCKNDTQQCGGAMQSQQKEGRSCSRRGE